MVENTPARPNIDGSKRDDLLIRVASMYYERDYSQRKIGDILNISRSNISRLLKEAKEKGLVEIRVHKRYATNPQLEDAIRDVFGVGDVLVASTDSADYETRLHMCGQLAAWHLEGLLQEGDTLAISWGTGVASAVTAMPMMSHLSVDVVQMIGSVARVDSVIDGPELARQLAGKLGGRYYYLHAPVFVDTREARDLFLRQATIAETLKKASDARVAVVGVGTTEPGKSAFLRAGHLSEAELTAMRNQGAAGETCGQHFDIDGNTLGLDINDRVIALPADAIRSIPYTVGVACGLHKKRAIIGALRGGFVKLIVTDDVTARAILEDVHV